MDANIPPQVRDKLSQFQTLQAQVQSITMQKQQLAYQLAETNNALEELKKTKDEKVYKVVGPILVNTKKKNVEEDLKEKKEVYESRIALFERQEKQLQEKLESLGNELKGMLGGSQTTA